DVCDERMKGLLFTWAIKVVIGSSRSRWMCRLYWASGASRSAAAGGGDRGEDLVDDLLAADALGIRLEGQQHAMAQHEMTQRADVLGQHVRAAVEQGQGARRLQEGDARTRARTVLDVPRALRADVGRRIAGHIGQLHDVVADGGVEVGAGGDVLQ